MTHAVPMNYSLFVPSFLDLEGAFSYLLHHPYLFISSSSVMTIGLVLAALTLGVVASASRFGPARGADFLGVPVRALRWLAPKLALTLVYFGLGAMALATEILIRFHHAIPLETEIQFRSGLGHLAVAAIGIALLWPFLRGRPAAEWIAANRWALTYWALQVTFLTPPWFAFQGELDLVLGVAYVGLGMGFAVTLFLDRGERIRV